MLRKEDIKRLDAAEMCSWRRMEKISWTEKISNEEVLKRIGEERQLMSLIRTRKRKWIGHSIRGEGLLKEVIKERMEGKRTRGRTQKGMLDKLKVSSYGDMKRRAEDREEWKNWMPLICH